GRGDLYVRGTGHTVIGISLVTDTGAGIADFVGIAHHVLTEVVRYAHAAFIVVAFLTDAAARISVADTRATFHIGAEVFCNTNIRRRYAAVVGIFEGTDAIFKAVLSLE